MARYAVSFAPRVVQQVELALAWWRKHRRRSPWLLRDEIDHALELVAMAPLAGRRVADSGRTTVRRILLPRSRYHLYYDVAAAARTVLLISFRHSSRG